jgi:hypothetical protein
VSVTASLATPFLELLIRPRATIRRVVDSDPTSHLTALAFVAGFFRFLDKAADKGFADHIGLVGVLCAALVVGAVSIPLLHGGAWLMTWSASVVGGTATREEVAAALAWSNVAWLVFDVPLVVLLVALFGTEWFSNTTPRMAAANPVVLGLIAAGSFTGVVWYVVV